MTDDTDPGLTVALDWWPAGGDEGTVKTVAFGPITSATRVLLELTLAEGGGEQLTVTVGNAPTTDRTETPAGRLRVVAELLGDLAQLIDATADDAEAQTERNPA